MNHAHSFTLHTVPGPILGFRVLLKDNSICIVQGSRMQPVTFIHWSTPHPPGLQPSWQQWCVTHGCFTSIENRFKPVRQILESDGSPDKCPQLIVKKEPNMFKKTSVKIWSALRATPHQSCWISHFFPLPVCQTHMPYSACHALMNTSYFCRGRCRHLFKRKSQWNDMVLKKKTGKSSDLRFCSSNLSSKSTHEQNSPQQEWDNIIIF